MKTREKKLIVISDLHCGHQAGLTCPAWNDQPDESADERRQSYYETRSALYGLYLEGIRQHGPFDTCIVNGDAIDGKGKRSGGNEQIIPDLDDQAKCAAECIRATKAKNIVLVTGTPYHTSENGEESEKMVAAEITMISSTRVRPNI